MPISTPSAILTNPPKNRPPAIFGNTVPLQFLSCLTSQPVILISIIAMDAQLRCQVQSALGHVPRPKLKQFLEVPPHSETGDNIFNMLLHRLGGLYLYRFVKGETNASATQNIVKKVREYCPELEQALVRLLTDDFYKRLLAWMCPKTTEDRGDSATAKKKTTNVKESTQNKATSSSEPTKKKELIVEQTDLDSIGKVVESKPAMSADNVVGISEGECLCRRVVSAKQQSVFNCIHCNYYYHEACMKKIAKNTTPQCLPCHLKLINPNKPAKKLVFLGVLRKDRKIHEFSFKLADNDLQKNQKIQVRCFRLKQSANTFILFPDYTRIEVNDAVTKEFMPLHKLSSLKYRKDQAFSLEIKKNEKLYKVKVSQQLPRKETKEDRIDPCDHLIGLYVVSDKGIKTICQQIEESCMTSFSESMSLLNSLLKGDNSIKTQEIILQMQQIPLICPLSSQRIKIPVRGLFCTHFQCFDLQNYLVIISNTSNPRWVCPLCKKPSYSLRVDCIILAIIAECKTGAESPKEVKIYRNGQFEASPSSQSCPRRPLSSLNIEGMRKRRGEEGLKGREGGKRQPKESVVICLDD